MPSDFTIGSKKQNKPLRGAKACWLRDDESFILNRQLIWEIFC